MGKVIPMLGGGTADSDELTANKSHVLSGYTAVTHDSDGEPAAGTMPNNGAQNGALNCGQSKAIPAGYTSGGTVTANSLASQTSANAAAGQILSGQTAWVNGSKITGSMANRGNVSQGLNAGGSYTIPTGYHAGSGKVTANSLASQTGGATADDSKVLSGYTYWKDGTKRTGNLTVSSAVSFSVAQYSNLTLIASWAKPSKGPWSGLRVICKQGGYPANTSDGTLFYEGNGTSATKSLAGGIWYFRAWNYLTTSTGRMYGAYLDKSCSNNQVKGIKSFASSGSFTVPSSVYSIDIFCVGGGGGAVRYDDFRSSGAGGGYTKTYKGISVQPGQVIQVAIGSGGGSNGTRGGTTTVGNYSASGGEGSTSRPGGAGGSGGGGSTYEDATYGGDGGADGSDGGIGDYWDGAGIGQHTTTRAFGESSGELYAGGGGGGGYGSYSWSYAGDGGAGGGGYGGDSRGGGQSSGQANTGGGAGGYGTTGTRAYNPGGSGIALIRWGY